MALVASSAPENKSGYALGVLQTSTALGAVIGPFVGGALADMVGYRPLFFIVAVLCTLAGFLVVFYAKEAPKHHLEEAEHHTLIDNYRYAFKSHHIRTVLVLIAISGIAITFSQPIFALYVDMLETNKKFLATIAGAIFSVAGLFMVISAPWWGKQNDIKGFKKNLTIAVSGAALSFSAQAFVTSSFQLVLLRAIQGFCVGGILPVLYSQINIHSERSRKGGIMGIASSFNILANIFGPSTGGFIAATLGLRMNFFLSGVFLLAALVLIRLFIVERISGMVEPQQIATVVAEEPL
jgi:DHA1 family multidrug resistance protein-like MFS transporter